MLIPINLPPPSNNDNDYELGDYDDYYKIKKNRIFQYIYCAKCSSISLSRKE